MAKKSTRTRPDDDAAVVEAIPDPITVTCPECGAEVQVAAVSTECNSCGCRVYR
jgi:hypothetical protein